MRHTLWPAYRALLRKSSRPILVGPFRGEVGFEALYWLPWLKRQLEGIDPERIYTLTRGGAGAWYGAAHGIDLYDLRSPQDIRVENALQYNRTGAMKQRSVMPFDRAVVKDAAKALGLRKYHVLHPAWMFAELEPYWSGQMTQAAFAKATVYDRLPVPDLPEGVQLPKGFAAVRFYFRHTFPMNPTVITYAKATIEKLASVTPVILLNSGTHSDEHVDYLCKGQNIYTLRQLVPNLRDQDNLRVVSAVLGRATAFVGTYGGLAQLALRHGIASISVFADWGGTAIAHKHLSDMLSLQSGVPFIVTRLTDTPFIRTVLPDLQFTLNGSSGARAAEPYKPLTPTA